MRFVGGKSVVMMVFVLMTGACGTCGDNNGTNPDPTPDQGGEVDAGVDATMDVSTVEDGGIDMSAEQDVRSDMTAPDMSESSYLDPTGASGTRLRRRYFDAGPGAYMTLDFWDTEMETSCSFGTAADGTTRCLPNQSDDVYFSDEGCSQPIYVERDTSCTTGWARGEDASMYRQTQNPAIINDQIIYRSSTTGCVGLFTDPDNEFWVAEQVPSAQFVRGTTDDETRADQMVARFVDGEDGSRVLQEVIHQTRGYTCRFDAEGRCAPARSPEGTNYEDSGCTEPIYSYYGDEPPALIAAPQRAANGCQNGTEYYTTGSEVNAATIYRYVRSTDTCEAITPRIDRTYFRAGAEVELPQSSLTLEGEGDVVARRRVDADGAPLGTVHEFWDATRDESCQPVKLPGDEFACLTNDFGYVQSTYFQDATCDESSNIGTTYCKNTAPRLLMQIAYGECKPDSIRAIDAVWEAGADIGSDYYFENNSVECQMRSFADTVSGYELGASQGLDTLPPLTLEIE